VYDLVAHVSLDAGVETKIISDRLGHASVNVTGQIYGHRSTGNDRQAANKVAGLIFGHDPNSSPRNKSGYR